MKKFLKRFTLILIIALAILTIIFRKKILLCYGIADKYISLKNEIQSTKELDIEAISTSMDYQDILYKNTNGVPLTLDIYSPLKQIYKSSPVILYVHGGSWAYGDKGIPEELMPVLDTFREQGYTIISTSYELMKNNENFEKQIADVKDTIRWIYKNKDIYNFDANEIGVMGVSSGAHLSLMAAYSGSNEFTDDIELSQYPSKIKYLIDFSGPTDLSILNTNDLNYDLSNIFSSISDTRKVTEKYNPINYVNSDIPNTLIIHSKSDDIVPYESSEKLYQKCKEINANVNLITLESSSHDLSDISSNDILSASKGLLKFIIFNSPF